VVFILTYRDRTLDKNQGQIIKGMFLINYGNMPFIYHLVTDCLLIDLQVVFKDIMLICFLI